MTPIPETVPGTLVHSGHHRPPLVASEVPAFLAALATAAGALPPTFAIMVQANVANAMNRLQVEALRVAGVEGVVGITLGDGTRCSCATCRPEPGGTPA